jgi:hypothetical protein
MRLKPLLSLTLIALALLAIAGSTKAQATSRPGDGQTPAQQHHAEPAPYLSPTIQISTKAATAGSAAETNYQRYYPNNSAELAAFVQAVAAVILILFGGWQMVLLWRSTGATEKAADAARDNAIAAREAAEVSKENIEISKQLADANQRAAEAAQLTLNVERPYVFFKSPQMLTRAQPESIPIGATIFSSHPTGDTLRFELAYELKNHGKGVAIIDDVRARFHLVGTTWGAPTSEDRANRKTIILDFRDRVLGPADSSRNFINDLSLARSTWLKILPHKLELILMGFVRFHDVFDRRYRQDFCFRYLVRSIDAQTLEVELDWFLVGPPKNNKYHEYRSAGRSKPE